MEKIEAINGYYYKWKDDETHANQFGFLAQEVEQVLPEVVQTDDEGYKSVDYSKVTPLLIEGIKEQQKRIDQQEETIKELKTMVIELQKSISQK